MVGWQIGVPLYWLTLRLQGGSGAWPNPCATAIAENDGKARLVIDSRPVPVPSLETQPFWDGCARQQLLVQQCKSCATLWHPPGPLCPSCLSAEYDWTPVSGRGTVYTFSVVRHPFRKVWEPLVPYVLAVIELAEGPRMISNVVDISPEEVRIGMKVRVTFQPISETITLPLFRPVAP